MEPANQRPVMDVARPPQKSAVPSDTHMTSRPATPAPAVAARPAVTPTVPRPAYSAEQHSAVVTHAAPAPSSVTPTPTVPESKPISTQAQQKSGPLAVRQAPKDDVEITEAKPSQPDAEPEHRSKPKPAAGQQGPVSAIVVTVLMMLALSALAIAIYVNV
jgi:hypothetical protein